MAFATPDDSAENTMESASPNGSLEDTADELVTPSIVTPESNSSEVKTSEFSADNANNGLVADDATVEGVKKRKFDDTEHDPETNRNSSPSKKPHLEKEIKELFPDLEKFWSTVEQDPSDFTAWTHLLQYVDQVSDKSVASEAYDAFLHKYPYCYGYWKKYADYTRRRGTSQEVQQIFNRGLRAIPLSVDLWIHFVTYIKTTEDDHAIVRSKFEEGIDTCGLEFRSDKLWEQYVQWESEIHNFKNAMRVWDQMISTPTQSLKKHFEKLVEFVNEHDPSDILSEAEYEVLSNEIVEGEPADEEDLKSKLRSKIIERRTAIFEKTTEEVKIRATYEEGIKRPYFHVKPVEKNQLKNWTDYLDFEIGKGELKRIITLFERCLIACAMYAEYWDKYLQFLQSQEVKDVQKIEEVFTRVTTVHHPKIYKFYLDLAAFEEALGNLEKASSTYEELLSSLDTPVLQAYYRHINFERRRNNLNKCSELFEKFLKDCKDNSFSVQVTIKYARFLNKTLGSYSKAVELLKSKLDLNDASTPKFLMALVELGMHVSPMDLELVLFAFDYGIKKFDADKKLTFARRKLEFLEDYTDDITALQMAEGEVQDILKAVKNEDKPEAVVTNSVKAQNSDAPKLPSSGESHQSGYNYSGDGPNSRYSSQYGQYPQGQYGGPPWNSHSQGPVPSGDPGAYGQSYVNQPTAWNSFYA